MSLKFGLSLPQGWTRDLASIKDPVEAYEAMTRVAQTADEVGFDSVWLVDHFHTVPHPSQEVTFESWTTTAALARDTKRIRVGQTVTCNGYRNPALLAKMASAYAKIEPRAAQFWHRRWLVRTRIPRLWL